MFDMNVRYVVYYYKQIPLPGLYDCANFYAYVPYWKQKMDSENV